MKKLKSILIIIVAGAIVGFTMSVLINNGLWSSLGTSLSKLNIILYFVLPVFFFFIVILVHELGHLFSFLFSGIRIRALFVLVFIIKRDFDNKLKFEIKWSNIKLIGGLVVPNFNEITTEEEYKKIEKKFAKALIDGPIASVVYLILSIASFLLVWILTVSYFWIAFLFIHLIVVTLMTILVLMSSMISTDNMYGDFAAYGKFKKDEKFVLAQINQYSGFSLRCTDLTHDFMFNKIIDYYTKNNNTSSTIFDISLLGSYIVHNYHMDIVDISLDELLNSYSINSLSISQHGLELAYLISAYHYKKGDVARSYEIFNLIQVYNNRHVSSEKKEILFKQYQHLININNNEEYIELNKDLYLEDIELLEPVINTEEIIKQAKFKLPFVEYYSVVPEVVAEVEEE